MHLQELLAGRAPTLTGNCLTGSYTQRQPHRRPQAGGRRQYLFDQQCLNSLSKASFLVRAELLERGARQIEHAGHGQPCHGEL